ncbi:MAG: hypothetical protein IKQ52_06395 [Bacteroidales bacterium]|nr:hypothetical protein [Bacteroidales bacterium]
MKKLLLLFLFCLPLCVSFAQRVKLDDCRVTRYYNGGATHTFRAYGNVYVETDPKEPVDLNVKVVTDSRRADFIVYKTSDTPKDCGMWRFVKDRSKANFTVYFVKDGEFVQEDCTICYTSDPSKAGWRWLLR